MDVTTTRSEDTVPCRACGGLGELPSWYPEAARAGIDDLNRRREAREREMLVTMPDGALSEYLGRLRRVLVMADEDGIPLELVQLYQEQYDAAQQQWQWRRRAAERGGPALARDNWRERVERARERADLAELIALPLPSKPAGRGKWMVLCPFHADKQASLSVDTDKGLWHCFGCQVGGDAFTWLELYAGLPFVQAVEYLERG